MDGGTIVNHEGPNVIPNPDFADVVRYAKEAIVIWRLDGTIGVVSPSTETLLGYAVHELEGQPISSIMPHTDDRVTTASIAEQLSNGNTIEGFESQWMGKEGDMIDMALTFSPIRDSGGTIVAVLTLGIEISTRKRLLLAELDQVFLASIVASSDDAIVSKSLDGVVTSWNPGAERIFGYTAAEMIGKPNIFQRFSQADSSITRNKTGLGVGLAIVKSLIELHGGTVSVTSEGRNKGAAFTIALPVYEGRAIASLPTSGTPVVNRSILRGVTELMGLKILVVDDEPDTCNLLRYIFAECGAFVETALSAELALETIDRWHPDMMISDISMPQMDGFELIRILRTERKNSIPAVALTAMARVEDRLKAISAGYQLHVPKPVEPSELIAVASTLAGLVERKSPTFTGG
jgi:PAS domain S-box-containing protein